MLNAKFKIQNEREFADVQRCAPDSRFSLHFSTVCISESQFIILHFAFRTPVSSFCIQNSAFSIRYFTFIIPHSAFCISHSELRFHHSAFSIPFSAFCILHFAFRTPLSTFCILHSEFSIPFSAFRIQHSGLRIPFSAFSIQPFPFPRVLVCAVLPIAVSRPISSFTSLVWLSNTLLLIRPTRCNNLSQ